MHLSRYVKIYPCSTDPGRLLLYSTKRGAAVVVPDSLLAAIKGNSLASADRESLVRLGFLVPDLVEERREMLDAFTEANRRSNRFTALVVLNMDCNLACTYCFEGGMKGKRYMTDETADALAGAIENNHIPRGKNITLSFYGGSNPPALRAE